MTKLRCPICAKPADPDYRPFCSRRCADVDLQRWFSGRYTISGLDPEPPEEGSSPGFEDDEAG
jgi:endogenous inhibitor of DNA gyrase (YacG/DUF329 family)